MRILCCGMTFYLVSSPLYVCGCGFHLWWSYNLYYTRVHVGADPNGDALLWGARGKYLGLLLKAFWTILNFNVIVGNLEVVSSFTRICNKFFNGLC